MKLSTILKSALAGFLHLILAAAWLVPAFGARLPPQLWMAAPTDALWRYPYALGSAVFLTVAAALLAVVPSTHGFRRAFQVALAGSLVLQLVAATTLLFGWAPALPLRLSDWYDLLFHQLLAFDGLAFCFLLTSTATAHALRWGLFSAVLLVPATLLASLVLTPPDLLSTLVAMSLFSGATWTGTLVGAGVFALVRERPDDTT